MAAACRATFKSKKEKEQNGAYPFNILRNNFIFLEIAVYKVNYIFDLICIY